MSAMHYEETVRRMAAEGHSASTIAKAAGKTRNAIIGYCHRRGIKLAPSRAPRPRPTEPRAKAERKTPPVAGRIRDLQALARGEVKLKDASADPSWPQPLDGIGIPFIESRPSHCRRPTWGAAERTGNICGQPAAPGSSYCAGCRARLTTDTYTY